MSTIRNPVGPLPPEVYWRRRLVVGLGALAVIVIIVLIIVRPGSGEPADQPTPDPATTESAAPGGEGETESGGALGEVTACTADQIEVTPVTDSDVYGPDQQPQLSLTITNTGAAPCTMQVGTDVQSYVITSGSDRIWASTDCQQEPVAAERILQPGEEVSSTPFPWSRTRSSPNDCDAQRAPVIAGGATYRLSVSVGEFESDGDRPFILN